MNFSGIYMIRNVMTDARYVGSTVNIKDRWACHRSLLRSNKHHNSRLQRVYNKYGADSIEFIILEQVDRNILIKREQYWCDYFISQDKILYNFNEIVENPMKGKKHSESSKEKMSQSHKNLKWTEKTREAMKNRIPWNKGKVGVLSQEVRERISAKLKGKPGPRKGRKGPPSPNKGKTGIFSEETLTKMSEAKKGRVPWNKGIPMTEDQKLKLSESKKGSIPWNKGRIGVYSEQSLEKMRRKRKSFC
jgi:group I intron endonuclease